MTANMEGAGIIIDQQWSLILLEAPLMFGCAVDFELFVVVVLLSIKECKYIRIQ